MTAHTHAQASAELEIAKERTYGGPGVEVDRPIPIVDLATSDRDQLDAELWRAAGEVGFFQLANHDIDQDLVDRAFAASAAFFALPRAVKARRERPAGTNSGWEFKTQKRPSTGTYDEKESYQITVPQMEPLGLWPSEQELAGFRATMEEFEQRNHALAMRVLASFARRLGFPDDFFATRHNPASPTYQSTVRMLHYLPVDVDQLDPTIWRAGAHTDYDCLTLLHQVPGQHGLQLSPGRACDGSQLEWTSVPTEEGLITCNIGDMLVRWSDDALRSTLHRVRMPRPGEYLGSRYSLAYFAQADTDAIVQGPARKYAPITAGDYLLERIRANFAT